MRQWLLGLTMIAGLSASAEVRFQRQGGEIHVEIDGKPADLAPFRRSNVARFRLSGGEASASHSGG